MIANLELALAGLAGGAAAAVAAVAGTHAVARRSAPRRLDPSNRSRSAVATVVLAAIAASVRAASWWAVPVTVGSALLGASIGRVARAREATIRSDAVLRGALAATASLYLLLPDTEGTMLVGGALVPLTVLAALRPARWPALPGGAATAGMLGLLGSVAVTASAGRGSALAVATVTALVVATLVVVAVVVLRSVTSGRGRPRR